MMFRSLGALSVLLMTTSLSQAAFDTNSVVAALQSEGYTRIEVKVGQTIAKVEAIKGTTKIEVTYDIASGDVIKTETKTVDATDDTTPGVEIDDDDEQGDDHGDDGDDSSDDGDEDHHGDNSGPGGGDDDLDDDGSDDGDDDGHDGGDDD